MQNNKYSLSQKKWSTHTIISTMIGSKKNVLDVGCNTGYIGEISCATNNYFGIELDPEAADVARIKYKEVIVADISCPSLIEFNNRVKFDVIVFADVLEHIRNPEDLLKHAISEWMHENSDVIISLPNVANWFVRISLLLGNWNYTDVGILDRTHLRFYTFASSKKFIEQCGLKICKVASGATFFGPVIKILPFLRGLLATNIIVHAKISYNK